MADTEVLQDRLFAELKGRIKEDDFTVPLTDSAFAYYMGYVAGGQHPRILPEVARQARKHGAARRGCRGRRHERSSRSARWARATITGNWPTPSTTKGSGVLQDQVRDLETGQALGRQGARHGRPPVWTADGTVPSIIRAWTSIAARSRFCRHRVGSDASEGC